MAERAGMAVWVPSHWRDTLTENPQAIVGMTLRPDDAEEWEEVTVHAGVDESGAREPVAWGLFVAGTRGAYMASPFRDELVRFQRLIDDGAEILPLVPRRRALEREE